MNADDLRALRAPLKDRYRCEPDAGVVTALAIPLRGGPKAISTSGEPSA